VSEWAGTSEQALKLLNRFLDSLERQRSVSIETTLSAVGRDGMLVHDLEVMVFNGSDRQIGISAIWLDCRSLRGGTQKGLHLDWRDNKRPTVVDAQNNDAGVAFVQWMLDILNPTAKWWYRVGIQLSSGRKRHSRWRRFPSPSEAYSGGNAEPD